MSKKTDRAWVKQAYRNEIDRLYAQIEILNARIKKLEANRKRLVDKEKPKSKCSKR